MLIHPKTKVAAQDFIDKPSHGLLISGLPGSGKTMLAMYLSRQLLGLNTDEQLKNYAYYLHIQPEANSIGIDQIRGLQKFLQLKVPGDNRVRRVAIISDAQQMTLEAQNALLKALEEPPEDTVIILTAPKNLNLRETIYSRVQQISVLSVSQQQSAEYFATSLTSDQIKKAFLISGGRAGLMNSVLNDLDHPLLKQIDFAKELMSKSPYERLINVDDLSKDRQKAASLIEALKLICLTAISVAGNNKPQQLEAWQRRLKIIYDAEASLRHTPSLKLLMSDLLLGL